MLLVFVSSDNPNLYWDFTVLVLVLPVFMYFDQLLLAARQVHVVYSDQLLCAAHFIHFISNHDKQNETRNADKIHLA